jgi:hypothetical protein
MTRTKQCQSNGHCRLHATDNAQRGHYDKKLWASPSRAKRGSLSPCDKGQRPAGKGVTVEMTRTKQCQSNGQRPLRPNGGHTCLATRDSALLAKGVTLALWQGTAPFGAKRGSRLPCDKGQRPAGKGGHTCPVARDSALWGQTGVTLALRQGTAPCWQGGHTCLATRDSAL